MPCSMLIKHPVTTFKLQTLPPRCRPSPRHYPVPHPRSNPFQIRAKSQAQLLRASIPLSRLQGKANALALLSLVPLIRFRLRLKTNAPARFLQTSIFRSHFLTGSHRLAHPHLPHYQKPAKCVISGYAVKFLHHQILLLLASYPTQATYPQTPNFPWLR